MPGTLSKCFRCGSTERADVLKVEDVRRRLERGELDGFRVTGELLEPVSASGRA